MTLLITWASLRYVQEMGSILGPQIRTQGTCGDILLRIIQGIFEAH